MFSALMMLRRVLPALRYAVREEEFGPILSAGVLLVVIGTVTGWGPPSSRCGPRRRQRS
jgi:hypothetical protein